MTPGDMDRLLAQAGRGAPDGEAEAAARAEAAILGDLHLVKPLAPAWIFTLGLLALFVAAAAGSASMLGIFGLHVLNTVQRAVIFSALIGTAWMGAVACIRQMTPAGGRALGGPALALVTVLFPALFAWLFQGYGVEHFVKEGIPCLVAGLSVAVPTGVIVALVLRRGYVLDWRAAGLAAGTLAGLAGLGMLELHCKNLKAVHVISWHVAVVLLSGLIGWVLGRVGSITKVGQPE